MRIHHNIISFSFYLVLLLNCNSIFCQIEPSKKDFFSANDSIRFYKDGQSNLIQLNKELINGNSFDIIISSQGIKNSLIHLEIRDSLINIYKYDILMDSLHLISHSKRIFANHNLNNVKGYYQYYSLKETHHTYFKEITVFKTAVLVSRFLFDDVKKSNASLPNYIEISPLISLFRDLGI